jgi:SurA-like N-terminal domain
MRAWPVAVLAALAVPASASAEQYADPVPPDAVADVVDTPITRATFDVWFEVAGKGRREAYDPPDFERCIARRMRSRTYRHLDGDRARLRRSCARDYREIKAEVVRFLIEAEWLQREAAFQGIAVSDARVRHYLEGQKRQVFRSEREFRRWLRRSGMTREMLLFRVRLDLLQLLLIRRAARQIEPTRDPRVRARREQRAITRYIREFRSRWEPLTHCAPGFVVSQCTEL